MKSLLENHKPYLIIFWCSISECFFNFLVNLLYSRANGATFFNLPAVTLCCILTLLLFLTLAMGNFCTMFSYNYTPVTIVAFGNVALSLALYVCQRSFLKRFYPGHGNWMEICGVIIVIFGMLFPIISWRVKACIKVIRPPS